MNPLKSLVAPRLPSSAIGLTGEGASVVTLDRRRDVFAVKRAGYVQLPEGLVRPSFDESNVSNSDELAGALSELVSSVGSGKRRRWSVALPEAATRTSILTLEAGAASRQEMEEMLSWKTERAMAAPTAELRVSRERLSPDAQGRPRYLVAAVRLAVLDEYESAFERLGWNAGMILPRHFGEAWWLMRDAGAFSPADSLLVSSHGEGFMAVVLRRGQPLLVRGVICDPEDRADELYRFLLFYRDRNAPPGVEDEAQAAPVESIGQMLLAGSGFGEREAAQVVGETLAYEPRLLRPEDLRLSFPAAEVDFNVIAAPAGLAALAWA